MCFSETVTAGMNCYCPNRVADVETDMENPRLHRLRLTVLRTEILAVSIASKGQGRNVTQTGVFNPRSVQQRDLDSNNSFRCLGRSAVPCFALNPNVRGNHLPNGSSVGRLFSCRVRSCTRTCPDFLRNSKSSLDRYSRIANLRLVPMI